MAVWDGNLSGDLGNGWTLNSDMLSPDSFVHIKSKVFVCYTLLGSEILILNAVGCAAALCCMVTPQSVNQVANGVLYVALQHSHT